MPRRLTYPGYPSRALSWAQMARQGYMLYNAGQNIYRQGRSFYNSARPYMNQARETYNDYQRSRQRQTVARQEKYNNNRKPPTTDLAESSSMVIRGGGGGHFGGYVRPVRPAPKASNKLKFVYENSGIIEDYNCVYLNHTTGSIYRMQKITAIAMLRALFAKVGVNMNRSQDDPLFLDGILGYRYRETPIGLVSALVTIQDMVVSVPWTLEDLAVVVLSSFATRWAANPNARLTEFVFLPQSDATAVNITSSQTVINLQSAKLSLNITSRLKIQNTTLNVANVPEQAESADAVDAPPLIGKVYYGRGQGPIPKSRDTDFPFLFESGGATESSANDGVKVTQANGYVPYQEPINADQLDHVTAVGSCKFDPGALKTSTIKNTLNMSVANFWTATNKVAVGALYWTTPHLAKFEMIALEKMIGLKVALAASNRPVQVQYECQQTFYGYVKVHNERGSPHYFQKDVDDSTLV